MDGCTKREALESETQARRERLGLLQPRPGGDRAGASTTAAPRPRDWSELCRVVERPDTARPCTPCPSLSPPQGLTCPSAREAPPGEGQTQGRPPLSRSSPLTWGDQPGTAPLQVPLRASEAGPASLEMAPPSHSHRDAQGGTHSQAGEGEDLADRRLFTEARSGTDGSRAERTLRQRGQPSPCPPPPALAPTLKPFPGGDDGQCPAEAGLVGAAFPHQGSAPLARWRQTRSWP